MPRAPHARIGTMTLIKDAHTGRWVDMNRWHSVGGGMRWRLLGLRDGGPSGTEGLFETIGPTGGHLVAWTPMPVRQALFGLVRIATVPS